MKTMKLEIGSGKRPTEGYVHLDIESGPHIEIVCDAKKIPEPDNKYEEVYSHWVLEHFNMKEMESILLEWKRILKPGGKMKIVTNNQESINKCLVDKDISWEEWNWLTFGDYKNNLASLHKIGFNDEVLMSYLTKIGMINISIDASWGCRGKDGELGCPALIVEATKL